MDVDTKPDASAASTVPVVIRHQGKKYDIEVDVSEPGATFKYQVYSLTGVQPENQKILIKGHLVKDETDLSKLGLKPGLAIMVLGQAGGEPPRLERPAEKPRFIEDMGGDDLAHQDTPGGLANLGNSCYLNASIQAMRAVPELQDALLHRVNLDDGQLTTTLARHLRDVYAQISSSSHAFPPHRFLTTLRNFNPRFAERSGPTYAQQDAEEAWTFIVDNLRRNLLVKKSKQLQATATAADTGAATASTIASATVDGAGAASGAAQADSENFSVVERYMTGALERRLREVEANAGGQDAVPERDSFLSLACHITMQTNHLMDGLLASMKSKITKHSDALGRDAEFASEMELTRLPKYLTVYFVRFYWKRDVQKKAKIMRKVTFPHELDVTEMCSPTLKAALVPVRDKVREVRKEIDEIERSKKKRKRALFDAQSTARGASTGNSTGNSTRNSNGNSNGNSNSNSTGQPPAADGDGAEYKTDAQIEAEKLAVVEQSKEELYKLVKPALDADPHSNHSGLYELRAIVAHQGASADSGHYTAFVKKTALVNPKTGRAPEDDGTWWWFNDHTVTEVGIDRINALAGGGESHSALILLYGSVPLPLPEGRTNEPFFQP